MCRPATHLADDFCRSGWNHSGRNGPVNFMNGVMGIVNGQRTLNIIRALAEFVCLPENNEVCSRTYGGCNLIL